MVYIKIFFNKLWGLNMPIFIFIFIFSTLFFEAVHWINSNFNTIYEDYKMLAFWIYRFFEVYHKSFLNDIEFYIWFIKTSNKFFVGLFIIIFIYIFIKNCLFIFSVHKRYKKHISHIDNTNNYFSKLYILLLWNNISISISLFLINLKFKIYNLSELDKSYYKDIYIYLYKKIKIFYLLFINNLKFKNFKLLKFNAHQIVFWIHDLEKNCLDNFNSLKLSPVIKKNLKEQIIFLINFLKPFSKRQNPLDFEKKYNNSNNLLRKNYYHKKISTNNMNKFNKESNDLLKIFFNYIIKKLIVFLIIYISLYLNFYKYNENNDMTLNMLIYDYFFITWYILVDYFFNYFIGYLSFIAVNYTEIYLFFIILVFLMFSMYIYLFYIFCNLIFYYIKVRKQINNQVKIINSVTVNNENILTVIPSILRLYNKLYFYEKEILNEYLILKLDLILWLLNISSYNIFFSSLQKIRQNYFHNKLFNLDLQLIFDYNIFKNYDSLCLTFIGKQIGQFKKTLSSNKHITL